MGNKVKFELKNSPANLTAINAVVMDALQSSVLWSGLHPTTGGNTELDIGSSGAVGDGVWVYGNNASSGTESTAKVFGGYRLIEAGDPDGTFDVTKIVMLGDSITNHSTSVSGVDFIQPYIKNKYGMNVEVLNHAIPGDDVATVAARCDAVFDLYANDPTVVVFLCIGINDVSPESTFADKSQVYKDAVFSNLNYIYDSAEQRGLRMIQASISFGDYQSSILKPTPEEQKTYELGTYTYTRDWSVEVMKVRAPQYLRNDWPIIDIYNLTRNHFGEWLDPTDETDRIHPSDLGEFMFLKYAVDSIIAISKNAPLAEVPERNFNVAYDNATTPLDMVVAFARDTVAATSSANINWATKPRPAVVGEEEIFLDNIIDVNGQVLSGVKVYSYANDTLKDGDGNLADPTNDTASLLNNALLQSALAYIEGSGYLCVAVEGLEANKWYSISFNAGVESQSSNSHLCWYQVTDEDNEPLPMNATTTPAQDNLIQSNFVTNSYGECLLIVSEEDLFNKSVMGGFRINTL